jgi:diamine N-acetyltransferase
MSSSEVTLREVTSETVRAICALEVAPEQRGFVAPNAVSIAQAHFEPKAWFRAVFAGDELVGFVMLHEDPGEQEYFLWRFMIAAEHQGKGYGGRALDLVVEHVRGLPGATELRTSYVPGEAGPRDFYLRYGFEETGEVDEGEHVVRLELREPGPDSGS